MEVTDAAAASQSGAETAQSADRYPRRRGDGAERRSVSQAARVEHRAKSPHKARAAKSPNLGDRLVLCAADLAREKRKRTCGEGYPALERGEESGCRPAADAGRRHF